MTLDENVLVERFTRSLENDSIETMLFRWRVRALIRADAFVFHWPDIFFVRHGTKEDVRTLVKVFLLLICHALGKKVIWVAHNANPHAERERFDFTAKLFFKCLDGVIFLSNVSRDIVCREHPDILLVRSLLVTLGDYRYDMVQSVRCRERAGDGVHVGYFGQILPYKNVPHLMQVFSQVSHADVSLSIAGRCTDSVLGERIRAKAAADDRISCDVRATIVPAQELEDFVDACDGIVLPYRKILNSGAVLFALTRRRPVLAPNTGSLPEVQGHVGADWLHLYDGALTAQTIGDYLAFLKTRDETWYRAGPDMSAFDWIPLGERIAEFICDLVGDHGSADVSQAFGVRK